MVIAKRIELIEDDETGQRSVSLVGVSDLGLALDLAREADYWAVQRHVIEWARKHRRENPTASVLDCIWEGYCQYVK